MSERQDIEQGEQIDSLISSYREGHIPLAETISALKSFEGLGWTLSEQIQELRDEAVESEVEEKFNLLFLLTDMAIGYEEGKTAFVLSACVEQEAKVFFVGKTLGQLGFKITRLVRESYTKVNIVTDIPWEKTREISGGRWSGSVVQKGQKILEDHLELV